MADLNVVWWNKERGSWSCCHLLNESFDRYQCRHLTRYDPAIRSLPGAILVFHGANAQLLGNGPANAAMMNDLASRWAWCIFISIGDEGTEFPLHLLSHPNSRLWVQAPLATTKADRYLIQGYPDHTHRTDCNKDLDWFFSGQITHERRRTFHNAVLDGVGAAGFYATTEGFGQGMPQSEYLAFMSRARIIPCPAGPATPDTFRVYEALECGAIPLLDARASRDATVGVWPLLLGDHPLPVIDDWSTLPSVMPTLLADWDRRQRWISAWWRAYKHQYHLMLAHDLVALGVHNGREETQSAATASAP